jgi:protoporphyrinogen oxidase
MILILGGGLAGLSTAYHLGDTPHLIIEGESTPGGLCRSRNIEGFTFDYTGHLLHMRDERALALVEHLLPGEFAEIERRAAIRTHGAVLPFPFQANLHGLPAEIVADCLIDFVESMQNEVPDDPATSFEDWSTAVFGRGISDAFMLPYNSKLFCREPSEMTADWVSWAVPRPNLREVVKGALGIESQGMGYNPRFRYPRKGGIGVLPEAFAKRIEHIRLGETVAKVDLDERNVQLTSGETLSYDQLVVTIPLPAFLRMTRGGIDGLAAHADKLDWSVVGCLNLGVDRETIADGLHWIYTPDADVPFYRVGFPSNICPAVAPPGTSSLYVEFGLPRNGTFNREQMEQNALQSLYTQGILEPSDKILAKAWTRLDPGYVIFDRSRQDVMQQVMDPLKQLGVHLIGRYGAWTYSYMERAMLDGLEVAEELCRMEGAIVDE